MSNVAGKAYALNVVTPTTRFYAWFKRLIFIIVRGVPQLMAGLKGLSFIHFARWTVIDPHQWPRYGRGKPLKLFYSYTIFNSNFNGTWDQYIDAFSDGIPYMLDLAWYKDFQYPKSIPLAPFQRYIRHNQIHSDYYYNATPGAAQKDIKASLRAWTSIRALAEIRGDLDPKSFAREYQRLCVFIQNDLGSMGPGTVPSVPTAEAHEERQQKIEARWDKEVLEGRAKEMTHGEL